MWLTNKATKDIQNDEIVYTIEKGTTEYISLTLKDEKTGNNYEAKTVTINGQSYTILAQ